MSEAEKKRRLEYKKNRKKWLLIQIIIIAVVSVIVLSMVLTYHQISKTYYVDYTEQSDIDYRVQLSPNEFYDEEWIAKDKAYVSSLIENIMAVFHYEMKASALSGMDYSYAYGVDATLRVSDKYTKAVIYEPVTVVLPETSRTQSGGQNLVISEPVVIDYDLYNDKAVSFINAYGLKDVECVLDLTFRINVTGSCEEATGDSENTYFTTLHFPLAVDKAEPTVTSSLSNGESKSMACTSSTNKNVFLVLGIVFGALDLVGAAIFFVFVHATRNHDINYGIKVKRLVANYRSFIQEISTPFATEGYQMVYIKTFNEMLEVRDTIGAPLLMYKNADGTATTFVVPSTMGILYSYEIRVDDYDDIYGVSGEAHVQTTAKKECFFKIFLAKICEFFCRSKKPAAVAEAAEGETTEGEATEGEATEGEATEGEATEGEAAEGEATEGEATEGEATEGEATEGEATEGEATEGEATEGEATEGESAEGEATEGEATEGEAAEGEATEGEATEGEATEEATEETKPSASFQEKTKAWFFGALAAIKNGASRTGKFFRGLFTKKAVKQDAAVPAEEEAPVTEDSALNATEEEAVAEAPVTEEPDAEQEQV